MTASASESNGGPRAGGEAPVLVATDLGESADEAIRQADAWARRAGLPLAVCHVLPELMHVLPLFPQFHRDEALALPAIERRAGDALAARVEELTGRAAGDYGLSLTSGSPHAGILRLCGEIGPSLLVVGAHGSGSSPTVIGGVTERVVRHAPCPVLVARRSPRGAVLAATDFSDASRPALEAGALEARRRQATFHVLHCVDLIPTGSAAALYGQAVAYQQVFGELRAQAQAQLDASIERFPGAVSLLREGIAVDAVERAARDLPAELVVVGTHGRSGLSRMLALGSVAEAVVRHAPCSVLVARPNPAAGGARGA